MPTAEKKLNKHSDHPVIIKNDSSLFTSWFTLRDMRAISPLYRHIKTESTFMTITLLKMMQLTSNFHRGTILVRKTFHEILAKIRQGDVIL